MRFPRPDRAVPTGGKFLRAGVAAAVAATVALAAAGAVAPVPCGPCAGDLDGNGVVDGADLGAMLGAWGECPPGATCAADLDGNGVVDGADLGALLGSWGACPAFEYPAWPENGEAFQIAMELTGSQGPLFPPPELVERVARDLELIRAAQPSLAQQVHTPAFQWDFLILARNQAVDDSEYQCLNAWFGATLWAELTALGLTILQFPGPINAPALALVYEAIEHVGSASASGIFGGENFWIPSPFGGLDGTWTWNVDDGFHDCIDGCDCHYYYTFSVTGAGEVTLLSSSTWGLPWCPWPK
ncbi:MAG TPA: hypothetical protein PKC43_02875 [Phycisphaerales bacterium]|nr:hypothetical protein [Phycisphaerales bacterium]HMP36370.1 hypothetical protein [Phycisphaerales bacterium]